MKWEAKGHAKWVQTNVRLQRCDPSFTLTPEQCRCIEVLSSIASGPHNIRPALGWEHVDFKQPKQIHDIHLMSTLATFDGPQLTNLVKAAHRRFVRVELSPAWVPAPIAFHNQEFGAEDTADAEEWLADRNHEYNGPMQPVIHVALGARSTTGRFFEIHPGLEAFR